MEYTLIFRWLGLAVWLCIALIAWFGPPPETVSAAALPPGMRLVWILTMVGIVVAYWQSGAIMRPRRTRKLWLVVLFAAVMGVGFLLPECRAQSMLLLLSTALATGLFTRRLLLGFVCLQSIGLTAAQWTEWQVEAGLLNFMFTLVIQAFVILVIQFASDERLGRQRLAEVNVQLLLAQSRLEHASREAERLHIARNLHDALGHHLTVLGLDLERLSLALRDVPASSGVHEVLEQTRSTQRRLMADARGVVSILHTPNPGLLDFARALQGRVPQLEVHLDFPLHLPHQLLPFEAVFTGLMQEGFTNTLRHARARNIWIHLSCTADLVRMTVQDDGLLLGTLTPGFGLRGLQDRFETAGGTLQITTDLGRVILIGSLPLHMEGE